MKTPPDNPEFARFTDALKTILKVPKAEITRQIEAEKTAKQIKRSAAQAGAPSPRQSSPAS
jgi:hypothetical protein